MNMTLDQETVINTLRQVKAICAATQCCTYCPFDSICLCPVNDDMPESWGDDYIGELADKFMKRSVRDD